MQSRFRKLSILAGTPARIILAALGMVLTVVFMWGFQYAELVSRLLPVFAVALCISLLLVPQRKVTFLLTILAGASIPFAHFAIFVVMGEGIQWIHLFGALLIIHFFARIFLGEKIRVAPSMVWVAGLLLSTVISLWAVLNLPGVHVTEFWKSEVQFIFAVLVYFAVTQVRAEERHILLLYKTMIILGVAVAIFGLYQLPARFWGLPFGVLNLNNPSLSGGSQSVDIIFYMIRSSSIFAEPSYYGHYMNGALAITLTAALHRPKLFGNPWILWGFIAILAVGMVVSFAMSAFYILGLVILVMYLTERQAGKNKILTTIAASVLMAGLVMFTVEAISGFAVKDFMFDRVTGIFMYITSGGNTSYLVGPESIYQRVDTARIAINVWMDHPLIGVGLGSYPLVSHMYGEYNPSGFSANALVNTLAELGSLGFLFLLGLAISSLNGLWRIFKGGNGPADDDETRNIRLVARMTFFLVLVELLYFHVQGTFFWPSVWYYLGLGGLVTIMARSRRSDVKV